MEKSVYQRPSKPRTMKVTRRGEAPEMALVSPPEIVMVDSFTECHVTPSDPGARMVDYLELEDSHQVCEPSAGTGNLIQELVEAGHPLNQITAIERHNSLCEVVKNRFECVESLRLIQSCFLEYSQDQKDKIHFPRILMNPPFKKVKAHINAALDLLGAVDDTGAVLVALVPITYQHDEAETLEELPNDTFSTAKVNTKIIRFVR